MKQCTFCGSTETFLSKGVTCCCACFKPVRTNDEWREVARGNIEQNLGNTVDGEDTADDIFDNAYTLAVDALLDADCERSKAQDIAREIAQCYAQP